MVIRWISTWRQTKSKRIFDNVKPSSRGFGGWMTRLEIDGKTEHLVDVNTTDKLEIILK